MTMRSEKPINFLINNHAPCVATEDIFEYVSNGLRTVGARLNYSIDEYRPDANNLLMEGCTLDTSIAIAALRKKFPDSRLYLIVTEILTKDGFNSANTSHQHRAEHYSNSEYWTERTRSFFALAAQVDGLIFFAESLIDGYRTLNLKSHYAPLVALPGYAVLERAAEAERDIDIFFSGTLTAYRQEILGALSEEGFKVVAQAPSFPDYVRRHYLRRTRLAIGLRLGPDTQFTSKQRAHYCLVNRLPHLFEKTPDDTDLHRYVQFAEPGNAFLDRCFDLLNGVQAFPVQVFEDFRQDPKLDPVLVFGALLQFLNS